MVKTTHHCLDSSKWMGCNFTMSLASNHRPINRSVLAANHCCFSVCWPYEKSFMSKKTSSKVCQINEKKVIGHELRVVSKRVKVSLWSCLFPESRSKCNQKECSIASNNRATIRSKNHVGPQWNDLVIFYFSVLQINPLKCRGVSQLHVKLFSAIQI